MAKCLVVDDSEVICFISRRIIEQLGHEAFDATNVADGIDHCKNSCPDVVMLDWDLPGLAALDFLKQVSLLDLDQRPEIILCATENDAQQFALAKAAGARYHVLKPFDLASVKDVFIQAGFNKAEFVEVSEDAETATAQTA